MFRLAANLTYLFTELPFLERFAAASKAGFRAVEFAFAYDVPIRELAKQLRDNGLTLALINTPPGNVDAGELGLAALPGREGDATAAYELALEYANGLDARLIHLLAGRPRKEIDSRIIDALFLENISRTADLAAKSR